jgi:CubicO group peptidase (beta-lactamase class C family)
MNKIACAWKTSFLSVLFLLVLNIAGSAQIKSVASSPESEGVSSKGIIDFIDAVTASKNELHGIVILRHGKLIAEGWANPYSKNLRHTMYSCSKSFTSSAIGFAVAEKKLTVNDKVVSFFPDKLPENMSPLLASLTIKDLLTMSVGHAKEVGRTSADWAKAFLAFPITDTPGTKFLYNSIATYMLSAIIQKVTGQKLIDYLQPRLFEPLGIENIDWETNADGINTGGWGLRLKTEDMAKFGQLYLQKGKWNGKQILPAAWIEEATTAHIIQNPNASQAARDSSDWLQGYGYQFWRSRNNSYRGDGAYGQYILVLPEKDAVIAITSETPNMQDELNLVWKYLLPAMKKGKVSEDNTSALLLKQKLEKFAVPIYKAAADSVSVAVAAGLPNKTFTVKENTRGIKSVGFSFNGALLKMNLSTTTGNFSYDFGSRNWVPGSSARRGPSLTEAAYMEALPPSKLACRYRWKNSNTLELVLRYIESPHTEIWTCSFADGKLVAEVRSSMSLMKGTQPEYILESE